MFLEKVSNGRLVGEVYVQLKSSVEAGRVVFVTRKLFKKYVYLQAYFLIFL